MNSFIYCDRRTIRKEKEKKLDGWELSLVCLMLIHDMKTKGNASFCWIFSCSSGSMMCPLISFPGEMYFLQRVRIMSLPVSGIASHLNI